MYKSMHNISYNAGCSRRVCSTLKRVRVRVCATSEPKVRDGGPKDANHGPFEACVPSPGSGRLGCGLHSGLSRRSRHVSPRLCAVKCARELLVGVFCSGFWQAQARGLGLSGRSSAAHPARPHSPCSSRVKQSAGQPVCGASAARCSPAVREPGCAKRTPSEDPTCHAREDLWRGDGQPPAA